MAELKRIFIELVVVVGLGLVVGVTANGINPDGLSLGRDYFRTGSARPANGGLTQSTTQPAHNGTGAGTVASATSTPQAAGNGTGSGQGGPGTETGGEAASSDKVAEALKAWGLQPIHFDEVKPLYEDLLYEAGVFIFIDARDQAHYKAGHIPGAHQLDYYFIDRYIDQVLPLAQGAEKVVIYCNGGDCEDSKLVADALMREHGLDPMKLFVYVGGMEEWKAKDMPVEKGARGSGDISGGAK